MKLAILTLAFAAAAALAQAPPPVSSEPQLSTAEKTALQSLEKQKADAQQAFLMAQQGELTIEREFSAAHPGYRINAQTLIVEKDAPEKK